MSTITTWSVLLIRPRVSGDELKFTSGLTLLYKYHVRKKSDAAQSLGIIAVCFDVVMQMGCVCMCTCL